MYKINTLFLFATIAFLLNFHVKAENRDTIVFSGTVLFPSDIGSKIQYYTDDYSILNIEDISKLNNDSFIFSNSDIINLGVKKSTSWLKLTIKNLSIKNSLFLEIDNPLLNEVTLYNTKQEHKWQVETITKDSAFKIRRIKSQKIIFEIDLPTGQYQTYYLKVKSNSQIAIPFKIGIPDDINARNNSEDILSGIYFGLMLVMFFYNFFIYFTVRDKSYLYYISYIISVTLVQLNLKGLGFKYIWPSYPQFEQISLYIFPAITAFTSIAFINNFLHTNIYIPKTRKIFWVFIASYIITIAYAFGGERTISYNLLNINALPLALIMIGFAAYIWFKYHYRPAAFFLIAWSFFLVSIILFVLKEVGVLPYNILTTSIILIGSAVEAVLLSFALADKINIYRTEKEVAQKLALEGAQENERIIREQNVTLELKVTDRTKELKSTNLELNKTLDNLKETQTQLVESEKMASLGQLTAGIAHEINNPINFVTSNVKPLKRDVDILLEIIIKMEEIASTGMEAAEKAKQINELKLQYDFDYLTEEIALLLKGINEGSTRTAEIVKGLRIFSRVDEDDLKKADINEGIDSTLIIMNNQLNGRIIINKKYGNIPLIECYPGKLNQVFLNLISNAIYAINAKFQLNNGGEITITTLAKEDTLQITVADNGIGMNEINLQKLFEPFYTTKPVGEGTGLGLSISYNTIKKHHGTIHVESNPNNGTTFILEIPIIHPNS